MFYHMTLENELPGKIAELIGKENVGDYNTAPRGWREITEKELVQKSTFRTYGARATETRQLLRDIDGTDFGRFVGVTMFWCHDGTGVALEMDYWAGTVRWYAFGCQHEYQSVSREDCSKYTTTPHWGMHCHAYHCPKCNHFYMVDSSG